MRFPYHCIATLMCLVLSGTAIHAQYSVHGKVTDSQTGKGLDAVNVMLRRPGSINTLGFVLTDSDGGFSITSTSTLDSLQVVVSGFNVKSQSKTVRKGESQVDFRVVFSEQTIREVVKKSDPMVRKKDTLTYYVEQFRQETDRSIGDVIQRLPGIAVTSSGGIKYQGKAINKFYIEGMDMLGNKYTIATNNIQASDIAAIEVMENHQPLKVLEDWVESDQAAINIRLKESARGVWNATMELGGGYSPAMWHLATSPMYFARKFQTIETYKTNNTGQDVSGELRSSRTYTDSNVDDILNVVQASTPPLPSSLWLRNSIHAVSANGIYKTGENGDMTVKAHYVHDLQDIESTSSTAYSLPDGTSYSYAEVIGSREQKDETQIELQYRINSRKIYFRNTAMIGAERTDVSGGITDEKDGTDLSQHKLHPSVEIRDVITATIAPRSMLRVNVVSENQYTSHSSYLEVSPNVLLADIVPDGEMVRQDVSSRSFISSTSASTSYQKRRLQFDLGAGAYLSRQDFESYLGAADSLRNNMTWSMTRFSVTPGITYRPRTRLSMTANLAGIVQWINFEMHPFVSPVLNVQYTTLFGMTMTARASHARSYSGISNAYEGYVMRNYRTLSAGSYGVHPTTSTSVSADLVYTNAIQAWSVDMHGNWSRRTTDIVYGSIYSGRFSRSVAYHMPGESTSCSAIFEGSKLFRDIATTVKMSSTLSRSTGTSMIQNVEVNHHTDVLSSTVSLDTRPFRKLTINYGLTQNASRLDMGKNGVPTTLGTFNQTGVCNLLMSQSLILTGKFQHYHNSHLSGQFRNLCFADLSLRYKRGCTEYSLEGNNLLNTKYYGNASVSALTSRMSTYRLRQRSILFKVFFSLR